MLMVMLCMLSCDLGVSRGAVFSLPGLPVAATSCLFPLRWPTQRRGFLLDGADFHELQKNWLPFLLQPAVILSCSFKSRGILLPSKV